ncbi:hypothetical protein FRAHR75_120008 [Frankia sp. Hr75.2]|nr:hypothetical protein FRAHR75_120008 [Frankia sp. Hr75.2]
MSARRGSSTVPAGRATSTSTSCSRGVSSSSRPGGVGGRVRAAKVLTSRLVMVRSGLTPLAAISLHLVDGAVRTIHLVSNPEKLAGLRDL